MLLLASLALGAPERALVLTQDAVAPTGGAPFADPAALRGWLLDEPSAEVRVTVGVDATTIGLRAVLGVLGNLGGRQFWLVRPTGETLGPLALVPPRPGPDVHVVGVRPRVDVQLRTADDHGPWVVALSPSPIFAPGPAASPLDCDAMFADGADRAVCHAALGSKATTPYIAGDRGCGHSTIAAVSAQLEALRLGADTTAVLEVQRDDALPALLDAIAALQAGGRRVELASGKPEALVDCAPVLTVADRVRAQTVAWLARRDPGNLVAAAPTPVTPDAAVDLLFREALPAVEACRVATPGTTGRIRVQIQHPPGSPARLTPPLSAQATSEVLACVRKVIANQPTPDSPAIAAAYYLTDTGTRLAFERPDRYADERAAGPTELTLISQAPLHFPEAAKSQGDARCIADVLVGRDGVPLGVEVSRCHELFWPTTERTLMKWRWAPPIIAGVAGPVWTTVAVQYRLR
jgi:hypothetical protein